ncbi:PAS domain-containing sensor histidine kinase [Neptunitalea lumnitzerae]|uniref:histidine kinase n=1 Tax=Neptunitalea lumnitzerae TaxID=2965509 RepID=A0ABQ5MI67_9FLAO|nr:sensor histidine kinase [Neptunitalea sp. Y10]GLB49083.1 hypothetical protein Y10_14510 [Neptunitalea sp. Y10]
MSYLAQELSVLLKDDAESNIPVKLENAQGAWIWNIKKPEERYFTSDFWKLLGYLNTTETNDDLFWQKAILKGDLQYSYQQLQNYLQSTKKDFHSLERYHDIDNEVIWIKCTGFVVLDKYNEPQYVVGTTEKKDRIQSLENHKTLIEHINEAATIGIWEVYPETEKFFWNKVTKEIYEVPENFEGTLADALVFSKDEDSLAIVQKSYEDAVTKGIRYEVETIITTAKGNDKWVKAIGIPVMKNGKCTKLYGLIQDITEEVQKREKLAHQEALFRNTFESSSIGMAIVGLEGDWLRVNKSLCEMLGYEKDELYKIKFQDITHPADLDIDLQNVYDLIDGKAETYQLEKRYFHKNGDIIFALLSVSIIKDNNGNPLHFVSQITNLSEQKAAYRKIQSLLEITQNQNHRLLNFAHIVSHNLRSHSGNLAMLLDLMKMEMPLQTNNDYFKMINQAVDNLSATIKHLNDVILVHTKKREDVKQLNLTDFIENTLNGLNAHILENNVSIENNIKADVYINYVPAYLDSILINLLSNAIKYKHPSRTPVINLSIEEGTNYIVLLVADNGIGIDLNIHKKNLFGMYKTFHEHPEAKGIGLFITKNQIEAMEGKIEVESTVNKGTTFKVYFKK